MEAVQGMPGMRKDVIVYSDSIYRQGIHIKAIAGMRLESSYDSGHYAPCGVSGNVVTIELAHEGCWVARIIITTARATYDECQAICTALDKLFDA